MPSRNPARSLRARPARTAVRRQAPRALRSSPRTSHARAYRPRRARTSARRRAATRAAHAAYTREAAVPDRAHRGAERDRSRPRPDRAAGRARPSPPRRQGAPAPAGSRRGPVRPRIRERREERLDAVAQVLERGRQDELLAEVLWILVRREARTEGRDLEKHAAR